MSMKKCARRNRLGWRAYFDSSMEPKPTAEFPNTPASVILLDEGGEVAELSASLDHALDIFHAGVVPEGEMPPVHGIDVAGQRVGVRKIRSFRRS